MKRASFIVFNVAKVLVLCVFVLPTCYNQSAKADLICSIGTVTGFANDSGGFGENSSPPAAFSIELTGLGNDAPADGFLDLTTFGDFSNASEYVEVSIEGDDFGRLWDNDTDNDSFIGSIADNDTGQEYGDSPNGGLTNSNAIAQLTEAQLDRYLADGVLTITFSAFGAEVNNLNDADEPDEFISAKVTLNEAATVPEPSASLILTLVGVLGTAGRRRTI